MELISSSDKQMLRELAKKQLEYASLPIMKERTELWHAHNILKGKRPMIVVEEASFESELLPPPRCTSPLAKELEHTIQRHITNHEMIGDDKVIPNNCHLKTSINFKQFNYDFTTIKPKGDKSQIAYQIEHIIGDLEEDLCKLNHSTFSYDEAENNRRFESAQDAIGDILPIIMKNKSLEWHLVPTAHAVNLMGLENLMCEMALNPDLVKKFLGFLVDDINMYLNFMEEKNLLTMNNGNDFAGAGSFGFTNELNAPNGKITTKNLWANINSQESSEISAQMYGELVFPFCKQLADRFGLVYYGCCEPVHKIWKDYLSTIENLRKVSVSAWCDEEFMGEALKGSKTIYSRKPSPIFLGVGKNLDEVEYKKHIDRTLNAAKGCELEFIFRDVYTLSGDLSKPARAIEIIRSKL